MADTDNKLVTFASLRETVTRLKEYANQFEPRKEVISKAKLTYATNYIRAYCDYSATIPTTIRITDDDGSVLLVTGSAEGSWRAVRLINGEEDRFKKVYYSNGYVYIGVSNDSMYTVFGGVLLKVFGSAAGTEIPIENAADTDIEIPTSYPADAISYVNDTIGSATVEEALNTVITDLHTHDNKEVLDLLSESDAGKLQYNGVTIGGAGGASTADAVEYVNDAISVTNVEDALNVLVTDSHTHDNKEVLDLLSSTAEGKLQYNGVTIYDDTEVKSDIANLNTDKQEKTDNTLETTDKTITGSINEVNGNLLDTVGFSADYKNIILNRKNGLNPYTIPISAIINNTSLAELKDIDATDIGNGKILVYDGTTQKHKYVNSSMTDELVKMDSATDAKYLSDLLDKQTIINDNGILKVKKLDGQEVTITEINYLKGLTMNVMDLVGAFANGGVKVLNTPVATYADLSTLDRSAFIDGISYIVYVLADETHSGAKTTYLCTKTSTTFFGNADSQRNFTTNPIDLANEVTGKLGTSNIDVDSLWTLLTINDTYKTLTANNEIFGTHGAKAMYDELTTAIGEKANATDLTTHTRDTTIHITSDERMKWNNKANASDIPTKTSELTNDSNYVTEETVNAELNKKINKTDISTTINSASTDDEIPTSKAIFKLLQAVYPVGSVYINTIDINPSTIFGFGTWERVAQNMTLWGASANGESGATKYAGLPNITGRAGYFSSLCVWNGEQKGAFKKYDSDYTKQIDNVATQGTSNSYYFDFDASLSNSIYGNSNTVQPPALVVNIWKRVS